MYDTEKNLSESKSIKFKNNKRFKGKKRMPRSYYEAYVGTKMYDLTVIKYLGIKKDKRGRKAYHIYLCECICGKKVKIRRSNLKAKLNRSCGCLRKRDNGKSKFMISNTGSEIDNFRVGKDAAEILVRNINYIKLFLDNPNDPRLKNDVLFSSSIQPILLIQDGVFVPYRLAQNIIDKYEDLKVFSKSKWYEVEKN